MERIELLAPAQHLQDGIAAINCGADAVYIGAQRFGARASAGNSVEDIERLARYAHTYWARVYVTINTLLEDHEIPEALCLIARLYEAGIDGLIIQDLGLLECDLPPLPLIASTQTHNTTPEKVKFLEQVGFQRVILARELSLEQIASIRAQTTVELECFVHGALCVSYSGQCYLSYAIGGRSGNRGQCAQPCRKRYTLKDAEGRVLSRNRYLLSLKDMNRSAFLRELLHAGISSFKIEGRLKDESYVKNIVSYYRQQIDAVLEGTAREKASSGQSVINFTPNPSKTFNRGYTTYFLTGKREHAASLHTPKSLGERIGTVTACHKRSFTLESSEPLHNGDGICFFDQDQMLRGTTINSVQQTAVFPGSMRFIQPGTVIYRNADHVFTSAVNNRPVERKISVSLTFSETANGFSLEACDEDGNHAAHELPFQKEAAQKPEHALATINKQLTRLGTTAFICSQLTLEITKPYFLPASQLNALRRQVLDRLSAIRDQQRPRVQGKILKNQVPYPEARLSYEGNVLNRFAEAFYRRHGVARIQPAAESGVDLRGKRVMTTKYCLKYELGLCEKEPDSSPPPPEPLYLVDEHGQTYELRFRCQTCEMDVFFGSPCGESQT